MVRTVISLDVEEKRWLDRKARQLDKPMTAVVRDAVAHYRASQRDGEGIALDGLLRKTRGIWKQGDGLAYQRKLRAEWNRP